MDWFDRSNRKAYDRAGGGRMNRFTADPNGDRDRDVREAASGQDPNARIDTKDIFRELIADEVRSGRLNNSRRKRIIRYAAQL